MSWTAADIPPQHGRVAVVTGANGGLGLATAHALAAAGAHVVMAARNQEKARSAEAAIRAAVSDASLEVVELDLGSLASVAGAAKAVLAGHDRVDLLITNAGVMATPEGRTVDGFETQFGTNHLGHWALTSHLLPRIVRTHGARVVTLTSTAQHFRGPMDPADPHLAKGYDAWKAYSRSKLANRHFAIGLHRQFAAAGVDALALTAHPGLTNSELQATTVHSGGGGALGTFFHGWTTRMGMEPERGALSQLRAATDPEAKGATMYGPRFVTTGVPIRKPLVRPGSTKAIRELWEVSEGETGLRVDVREALSHE
jgi:NAD(P)-dependent dehydrogenase (short-subunit alcohol dehydrogenase family)